MVVAHRSPTPNYLPKLSNVVVSRGQPSGKQPESISNDVRTAIMRLIQNANKQTNKNYVQCRSWVCSKWPVVVGVVNDTPYNIVTQSARILLLSERVTYASLTSIPNNIPYRILFVFSSPLFPRGGRVTLEV